MRNSTYFPAARPIAVTISEITANGRKPNSLDDQCIFAGRRAALFEALLSISAWVRIHYLWRQNLPDEADNHVQELAVAAGAGAIITANVRDFGRTELLFPSVRIRTPGGFLKWRQKP